MTITQRVQHSLTSIFILSFITVLTACGGGGGGNKPKPTPTPDSTPNGFTFTAVTGAAVNAEVTSNDITVSGINQPAAISVTGGEYSVAGGAFTAAASTVTNGQAVKVKVKTSATTNTPTSATLSIGGVTGTFTVTTAPDVIPDAFTFAPTNDVEPSSINTSAAITVAGIDIAVPISVTGGEYSINDGAFTSVEGTVSNGQTVKVKQTAAANVTTASTTTLTIGGMAGTYVVTTAPDHTAPTAQILFPPPVSMTEGATILVRGSAKDEFSTITSVKVNGIEATTNDGFANWQATVTLNNGFNDLLVTTEDSADNASAQNIAAARASIKKAALTESFPDAENPIDSIFLMVMDKLDGRSRLLASGYNGDHVVYSIDLATGKRTIFAEVETYGLIINPVTKKLIVDYGIDDGTTEFSLADPTQRQTHLGTAIERGPMLFDSDGTIHKYVKVSRVDGEVETANENFTSFTILSAAKTGIPDTANEIKTTRGIALDRARNRYLITDDGQQTVFAVDRTTGVRSIFSSNSVGSGEAFGPVEQKYLGDI
ncbi:MAG: hypothetical protein EOO68_11580, partial [Moraxellaceae bacterium]